MSNDIKEEASQRILAPLSSGTETLSPSPVVNEKPSRKTLFSHLNNDLKQALDTWETLTEVAGTKLSPDELQLLEVKRLLGELKSKLSEFND